MECMVATFLGWTSLEHVENAEAGQTGPIASNRLPLQRQHLIRRTQITLTEFSFTRTHFSS
jgi:hypothetical protein